MAPRIETQDNTEKTASRQSDHLVESCSADLKAGGSAEFKAACAKPDTASPHLPSFSIEGFESGAEKRGALNTTEKSGASVAKVPDSKDPRFKEVKEGFIGAKGQTKGWDSSEPPSGDNIKEKIGDSRVLLWGDDHGDRNSPTRFSKALESLKTAGVKAVAMEGFRENQQPLVDQWKDAGKGTALEKSLEGQLKEYVHTAINDTKEFEDKMMDVMRAAKDAGLKVLCVEPNGIKMTFGGDGEGGHPPGDRNENWTEITQKYLTDNPSSKVVAFAGTGHFIHLPQDDTFADKIAKSPFKATDITPPSDYVEPK